MSETIEPEALRHVLGHYPTGVCVVTAMSGAHGPIGMAVGSFSSASLDPPLVLFLPQRDSWTWPRIVEAEHFCVNVLGADQIDLCQRFAVGSADKFAGLDYSLSKGGNPVLPGVGAWIDCDLDAVHEAGDHDIALGRVREMAVLSDAPPLIFFRGGYGDFAPHD